jgi:chromosome segregation ATPase
MSELEDTPRTYSGALLAVLGAALVLALGGLIWSYTLNSRLTHQEAALAEAKEQNVKQAAELRETNARLQVATDQLRDSLGLTQRQLDTRSADILAREQSDSKRLESAQKQTAAQVNDVSGQVSTVKTDVSGVRTDLGKAQTDLATTISQLQSMKGDVSDHSSLIARNHDELELLKHKGDRNFYEFVLNKGERKPVGTVSLELRKTDAKKSKFTLEVYADDKTYEKKDRNLNEPLQFYSGKDPALFEIVVNSINAKNQIAGYLSVPKGAPVPPTVPAGQ